MWSWLECHDLASPEAAELFGDVELVTVPEEKEQTAEEYLTRIRTTSAYLTLDSAGRSLRVLHRPGHSLSDTLFHD